MHLWRGRNGRWELVKMKAQTRTKDATAARPKGFTIVPPPDLPRYAWPAWLGCLHWALGSPEILAAFTAETGIRYHPPRTALEGLIDEVAGYDPDAEFLRAFLPWMNANVWGAWDSGGPGGSESPKDGHAN
jgi:hypothetical protein